MRIQLLLILVLVSINLTALGQTDNIANPKLLIKISPLSLIDIFGNTSCNISLESKKINNISVSTDVGILYYSIGYGLKNNRGWRGGLEIRKYFKKSNEEYVAINYSYKNQEYEFCDSIIFKGLPKYSKVSTYSKEVHLLNILYGVQAIPSNKKFFVNGYIGIGIRYKNTRSIGLTNEELDHRDYGDSQIIPIINWTGKHLVPNIVLGFKIGYVLIK